MTFSLALFAPVELRQGARYLLILGASEKIVSTYIIHTYNIKVKVSNHRKNGLILELGIRVFGKTTCVYILNIQNYL